MRGSVDELEVGGTDVGDAEGGFDIAQLDDDDAVAHDALHLALYAQEGATDDAHPVAGLVEEVPVGEGDALAIRVGAGLGVDEVRHVLVGDVDNLRLLGGVALLLRHELQGQTGAVFVLQQADNLFPGLDEDEVGDDRAGLVEPLAVFMNLSVLEPEIGGEAFAYQLVAHAESPLGTGVTDAQGIPAHQGVVVFYVVQHVVGRVVVTVEVGLGQGWDEDKVRSVRAGGTG